MTEVKSFNKCSTFFLVCTDQCISVVLVWEDTGVSRENSQVETGDHIPSKLGET